MSKVLVNGLKVRVGPSISSQKFAHYDKEQIIKSGYLIVQNKGRPWSGYIVNSRNKRYICMCENR